MQPEIISAPTAAAEVSPKKDKRVKSYMKPIGNIKGAPTATVPVSSSLTANRRSNSPLKPSASNKSMTKNDPISAQRKARINKPDVPPVLKNPVQFQDIQKILD